MTLPNQENALEAQIGWFEIHGTRSIRRQWTIHSASHGFCAA